ncbi:MAG: hypothetical protein RUMPE_01247 [Eubacteriales bacterium SKADARSKE-1]|nr:hypothetical protein [Eubacteriales bacterium SKADARSKE-1]
MTHTKLPMHDQDTVNSVCYKRILHLPFKFNVMNKYYKSKEATISCFGLEEANTGFDHPEILHFSPQKPWNQNKEPAPKEEVWWEHAKDTAIYEKTPVYLFDSQEAKNDQQEDCYNRPWKMEVNEKYVYGNLYEEIYGKCISPLKYSILNAVGDELNFWEYIILKVVKRY